MQRTGLGATALIVIAVVSGVSVALWPAAEPPASAAARTADEGAQPPSSPQDPPLQDRPLPAMPPRSGVSPTPAASPSDDVSPIRPQGGEARERAALALAAEARWRERVAALVAEGTKQAYVELLRDWRAGTLSRAQELSIDDAVSTTDSLELTKAAGRLLLEEPKGRAQQDALAALLASAGEHGLTYLLEGIGRAAIREASLGALRTVADPGALPILARLQPSTLPADAREAIRGLLRNVDTPKARDLELRFR